MKKIISILLLLAMCFSLFAGCKKEEPANNDSNKPDTNNSGAEGDLESAKAFLTNMYQTGKKGEPMVLATDKDLVSVVVIGGVSHSVEWSISITQGPSDSAAIAKSSKENHVLLDINETPAEDILFTATATIKDPAGKTDAVSFSYKVAASVVSGLTDEEIVELAYQLAKGEVMEGSATLTGEIKMVKTAYDESYQNITVIIQIGDLTDKRIECYRLKGEGAKDLAIGDTITVTGVLKNYNGTIEFDAGCVLDNVVKGEPVTIPTDPKEIVNAAYGLAEGDSLPYSATLTGVISAIDTPYDEGYQNISVIINVAGVEDKPILVYRLKGEGAATLDVGDTITVTGYIVNYKGTVEYTAGCVLDKVVKQDGGDKPNPDPIVPVDKPTTVDGILKAAKALKEGEELPYDSTLTGLVTKVDEAYSEEFKNITVTFSVNNTAIKCYRLKVSADKIPEVGDKITVTGVIKNFYGKLEFVNCTCDKLVPGDKAPTDAKAIVDAAYALPKGEALSYEVTLTGKVTEIDAAYSSQYKNISVIIAITGREDKPILCFRMKGDGIDKIFGGDTITVTGIIKNYNGTIEFDAGCVMTKRVSGGVVVPTNPKEIVDAAFALAPGSSLPYTATLTGKIKSIDTPYDDGYKNITVTIEVEGTSGKKDLVCYRMKGEGAEALAVGDTITVTGILKNHLHSDGERTTVEFDAGCTFTK